MVVNYKRQKTLNRKDHLSVIIGDTEIKSKGNNNYSITKSIQVTSKSIGERLF